MGAGSIAGTHWAHAHSSHSAFCRIKPALLGLHHNTGPLVDIAEAARLGLRRSPEAIAGPVNLNDLPKPIFSGLWYTFMPAMMLHAVMTNDLHARSGVAVSSPLRLHWQLATLVVHFDSYDFAAAVLDVVWWAVLLFR